MSKHKHTHKPQQDPLIGEPLNALEAWVFGREKLLVALLCVLCGIRVFVFSAGFPLYNNVDETAHFDYVYKASRGHLPTGLEHYTADAFRIVERYASPEYLYPQDVIAKAGAATPIWKKPIPPEELERYIDQQAQLMVAKKNVEMFQPPVYYLLAGRWFRLGEMFGIENGGMLSYWVRFLNVLIVGLLVWAAWLLVGRLYPERPFVRIGVPLILAFLPQDVFYSITNGVLTPLLFTLSLYGLVKIYLDRPGYPAHVLTGLAIGCTLLTMYTNMLLGAVVAAAVVLVLVRARREGRLAAGVGRMAVLCVSAALLPGAWIARNYMLFGHPTLSYAYMKFAHWTPKPFLEMWDHPIFTLEGAHYFWTTTLATYFRGEYAWNLKTIASPSMDWFYAWFTTLLLVVVALDLIRRRASYDQVYRLATVLGLVLFAAGIMQLIAMSMRYDFDGWFTPSRVRPYFATGRLIIGNVVPFLAVYVLGIDLLLGRIGLRRLRLPMLALIVIAMLVSEIILSAPMFGSQYNFFHLFGG